MAAVNTLSALETYTACMCGGRLVALGCSSALRAARKGRRRGNLRPPRPPPAPGRVLTSSAARFYIERERERERERESKKNRL